MDSDLPYWPEGLDTPLVERRHQILPRSQITEMESGRKRIRRLQLEPIEVVDVTWNFVADAYVTFRNFFINDLKHGSLFFVMETIEPSDGPSTFIRFTRSYAFLDGKYNFSQSDNLFTVSAILEVDEEEQEEYPSLHIRSIVSDSASTSASFSDGELGRAPEEATSLAGFLTGEHFLSVTFAPDQADEGSSSSGFLSGVYLPVVVFVTEADEGSSVGGFLSGVYTLIVIVSPDQADEGSSSSGFLSGVYTLTSVPTTHSESSSSSAGFQSGSYVLA